MKKRILSLLLAALMVMTLVPTAALAWHDDTDIAYAVTGGNIYFDKETGTITGCDYDVTEAIIPTKIDGVAVTSIGWTAFMGCESLTSVTIPNSVTSFDFGAFSDCTSLTSITIPDSVTSIGIGAFARCESLTSITIPNSVTSISNGAFNDCKSLASVTIPNSVVSIGDSTFEGCTGLISVDIPNSVASIGEEAFEGCTSLMNINVAAANTAYCSVDGVLFSKDKTTLIIYPEGKTDASYVIPNSVTSIGSSAFRGCTGLTSVDIPNSVTSVGDHAFSGCSSLMSVTIPDGVTSIGLLAFCGCTGLTSITIPDSVTSIGNSAFADCTSLTSITISNSVMNIDGDVFRHCTSLTSVIIPNSVTSIGYYAFHGCKSLTDVYYSGSEEQWNAINIDEYNECLTSATIHYNSVNPIDPVDPVNPVAPVEPVDPVTPTGFSDVASGSYCYDAVQWAVGKGITNGTDSTHFSPNAGCTRAQVVTFLWRAAGSPDVSANISFVDVSASSVYYKAIKWAVANGITKGTDATHFSPNATCTRGQVVTFMYRAAGEPAVSGFGSFSDVVSGSYCYNAVQWAVANGITKGTDSTHFSPNATCTRGQVVTFLYRAQ